MTKINNLKELEAWREKLLSARGKNPLHIVVGGGTCGEARGSLAVKEAIEKEIKAKTEAKIDLKYTGCHGFCQREPIVIIGPYGFWYAGVKVEDAKDIVESAVSGKPVERLLYEEDGNKILKEDDIPFYRAQKRVLLSSNRVSDPLLLEDYVTNGGYSALAKALSMAPEAIIEEIKKSGLRGRGGGGFPTGRKWETVKRAQPGEPRYVICNADEGDPGAYMDRSLLEGNPHSVIEGMLIGAFAMGAAEGYIYVRNEYPLAVRNISLAIEQLRKAGLIGKNVLGSGFDFVINVRRGGGAFVCGESTALMASLEGKIGEPRAKYIHTAEYGLWNKPSCLNNVETWANVPIVINNGADWFASIGTKGSKGTKIFSLVGKINNTGLVEVPMGIKLREIIENIGGGIPNGRKFKAVQTGGPSGGCIPENMLDLPVDFDELAKAGSMMGSGGMIVMDEDNCMVEIARYFTEFLADESCGKCTPCREGLKQLSKILNRISAGEGHMEDLDMIEHLAETITDASICALGGTAANPVMSTLKYFRNEYEAHIKDKKCPARVCKKLIKYTVVSDQCTGCTACARACPEKAVTATEGPAKAAIKGKLNPKLKTHAVIQDKCIKCGLCFDACKYNAIKVE